jgi:pheromone shutdown protein TraB
MAYDIERVIFVAVIHTDQDSVRHAREVVRDIKPDVVAVELDHERYQQLMNQDEDEIQAPSSSGDAAQDLVNQLALLEQALGEMTGSGVGEEMMAAIEEGRTIDAKIALVDRPMKDTIQRMMQIPLDELYKLSAMLPEAAEDLEEGGPGDLFAMLKEDGAIEDIMEQFREEFPNLTRVLIEERDQYVAKALHFILGDVRGKIVAVLGAGHIQGVRAALERLLKEQAS